MPRTRKKKLVKSRLQLRMTAVFLAVACSTALFQVVVLNWSLLRFASDLGVESGRILEGLPNILLTNLGLTFALLVPLMLFFGVQVTHRIAGPIYRFERFLDDVMEGKESGRCRIRDTDELHELCEKLNGAVDALRAREEAARSGGTATQEHDAESKAA